MKRGDIWTVAGGNDYAGKPRPVASIQNDGFDATLSITICAFTTAEATASLFRPVIKPSVENGLRHESKLMVDKVTTLPKTKLGKLIGRLADEDVAELDKALLLFLGLATAPRTSERNGDA